MIWSNNEEALETKWDVADYFSTNWTEVLMIYQALFLSVAQPAHDGVQK